MQVFGTANGAASFGTVINSSGQVGGGYITLASGQTEAFLSTARGGLMVGLGAGASTDSTQVAFLNDSGQAIIWDTTSGMDYLYRHCRQTAYTDRFSISPKSAQATSWA